MIPKFRAWDIYEKEMLENVTPLFDDSNSMIAIITEFQIKGSAGTSEIEIESYDTTLNWDEFPYILMRSTGLKDTNGIESWEGNYLTKEGCWPFFIEWIENEGCLMAVPVNSVQKTNWKPVSVKELLDKGYVNNSNIYENPELLEGQNE